VIKKSELIPDGLKTWFVIHFTVDLVFAIPLLLGPEVIMPWFGWQTVDPLTSRLVGAALLGIGVESLFSRNASPETFLSLLRLKIIWASGAIFGMGLALIYGAPSAAWGFIAVFLVFLIAWIYFFTRIKKKALV
jgi:hypothetical protein